MGNKLKKLIMFLVVVLGMTLFANEEQKAPNEIIKDNPEREVTTVESMKVRDHATMSLSVTKKNEKVIEGELDGDRLKVQLPVKGINENTLDRMAKPKEGKKLVVESKSKINPRMATKDIKKMPTQEEMNNLTVEQIQAMMSNTTGEKEEKSQSKNIKNHIAIENEEGIDVEILGVNKNEDIYVNVEENGQVVARYRVAINTRNTVDNEDKMYIADGDIQGYLTDMVGELDSGNIWLINKFNYGKDASIKRLSSVTTSNTFSHLAFYDDFFGVYRLAKVTGPGTSGAAFFIQRGISSENIPMVRPGTVTGAGIGYENLKTNTNHGINGLKYSARWDGKDVYPGLFSSQEIGKTVYVNSFRTAYLKELDSFGVSDVRSNYITGEVTRVNFELAIDVEKFPYPGPYTTSGFIDATYRTAGGKTDTIRAHYINVDVGDENIEQGKIISEGKQWKYTRDGQLNTTWTEIPNQEVAISFMKKNSSDLGLFLQIEGEQGYTKIARATSDEDSNHYSRTYSQVINGVSTSQTLQIKVFQADNQWAKVKYRIANNGDIKNPNSTDKPQFVFYIIQGRDMGGGKVSEMRRVKYVLNFPRVETIENVGSITVELDPRLQQILGTEKLIGTGGEVVDININNNQNYSNMLHLTNSIIENFKSKRVNDVDSVEGKIVINGGASTYKFFGIGSSREIGLKKVSEQLGWYAGNNNDLIISPSSNQQFEVKLVGENNIKYNLNVNVNYAAGVNQEGYSGIGTLNMSGAEIGADYIFNAPSNGNTNTSTSGITMQVTDKFPNLKGIVTDKIGTNIANKVEISYRNVNQTINLGNVVNIDGNLQVGLTNEGAIKIRKLKSTFDYSTLGDYHTIKIKYRYNDVILGTFTLKVKSKEIDAGSITFQVDPRLKQLTTSKGSYISSAMTIGGTNISSHDQNNSYPNVISITAQYQNSSDSKKVDDIYYLEGKQVVDKNGTNSGIDNNYIGFGNNSTAVADIILKNRTGALSYYGSSRDALISFTDSKNLKGKLKHLNNGDEEAYNLNFVLNYVSGVSENGYSGTGIVNVGAAELGQEYIFPTPINGITTVSGITMTVSDNFPNIKGIVSGTTTKNIADNIIVKLGNNIVNQSEYDSSVIGERLYNIENKLKVGLTNDGEIKIIKLAPSFDYDTNNILLEYKYKDIVLGTFALRIKSEEVEGGSITFNIDPRLEQLSSSLGKYITGSKTLGSENYTGHTKKFLEFIEVLSSYQNGAESAANISVISIKDKEKVTNSIPNGYIGFGTTASSSADIILKSPTGQGNYYGGDTRDTLISILDMSTYESKLRDINGKVYNLDFIMNKNKQVPKSGYSGEGKLNLWTAKVNKNYTLVTSNENEEKLLVTNLNGTLPKLTGVLTNYTNQIIASKYKVIVNEQGSNVNMKNLGEVFSILNNKVEINLKSTISDNLIVKKLSDEKFEETTVLIEYYHENGIKLGEYTLKLSNTGSETDYGTLTTKVDPRFVQYDNINYSNFWISSGGITNSNLNEVSLSPLIGILKTTRNMNSSKNIKEIISVKDGSNNIYSEETGVGEYPHRYKKASDYLVAIKSDKTENIGIESFETNNLIARKYKDNDAGTLTINFRAKDNSRGVFYHKFELLNGPTKEFTADGGYTGSGTVDFTGRSNSTYTLKDSGAGNNEITVNGNGHLPVINGMIDEDSLLATHYKVNSGAEVEITQTSSVANGSYTLSFDTTTFTTKLQKNNDNTVNTPITIEYLYKKNNKTIKLGSYILTINNTKTEDIGTQTVNIDGRMATSKNGHWILTDGKVVSSYSIEDIDDVTKYDKMISISDFANEYFTSSNTPSKVEVVGYRELSPNTPLGWVNNEKYGRVVFNKSGSYVLVTLPKNKTPMNKYRNELAVNLDNSSSNGARNPYTFILTVDGKRYKGTVNAKADNTHTSITGNATLNLTGVSKGTSDTWASKSNGTATFGKMNLVFTNGKTLFDMGSYGGTQITNKFSYKIGNNSTQSIDNTTSDIDLNNSGVADIRVAFVDDGLQITKLSNEIINGVTVTITPKYNDITLGVLNLTVTNTAETLGNITVAVDRRLAQIKATDWVGADGNLYDNTGLFGNYSNLIKAEDGISNTVDSYKVIDIEAINTTLNKDLINADGNRASYKYYDDKNKNILALPYNTTNHTVTLGHYNVDNDSLIVVSKKDIESTTRSKRSTDLTVTNSFMLTARTTGAQPEDKLYTGNVIEKYVGKESYSGSGSIDLGNSTIDKPYIFKTTVSNGNIESNDSNIKIAGASDDPVNSLDIFGDGTNIANKLTVEFTTNGNTRQSRTTTLASNTLEVTEHNLSVGIDTTDGGLTLTRKGGSDVTKAIITYYYDPQETGEVSTKAVTLGTFILNITNANPVTDLGTLTTVIDPRLGNLKNSNGENVAEKEWLTLDGYTGTNLDSGLKTNEYPNLIKDSIDGSLNPVVKLKKITKVFKGNTQYEIISGGPASYTRFGTKSPDMPYVAIKLVNGGSLDTSTLTTNQNFARKVSDIGAVIVEAEGELNQRYSFKHNLAIALIPISGYEKDKGYVGTGSIDLSKTPISENYYILVPKATKSSKNSNSEEEIQLDNSTGMLPNLTGLIKEYKNKVIASKYTVTINGKEGEKKNLGDEVDIVPNQVKIKLESGTDGKQLKIKKLTDEDVTSTMVTIKYYHESGIQLGEYDLTISNSSTATSNETITTKVDPRFIQVALENNKYRSYWLATNDIVGNNLESTNLVHNMSGIIKSTLPSGISTISEVIEIKNSKSEIYKKVTGKVGGYTKYYLGDLSSGQNFAVKLGENISSGGTIARKYSDNENGDLTIKYVTVSGATPTKKSFTHKLKLVKGPTDNFSDRDGYSGSGTVDLSNKNAGKYRIVKPQEPSPPANSITDLEVESYSGHFPVLTGLVTDDVIATHYSINGGANYIKLGTETEVETDRLNITLDTDGNIILNKLKDEKVTDDSVTIDYFYFSDKDDTNSTKIKLGSFTLNINDSIFELEPNTQALDFGTMFYDSRDGKVNHVKRTQKFTLKAHGKEVDFRVADNSEMTITGTNNKIDLIDVKVTKKSNTEFELGATAVLDETTASGIYNGEIQVIVDITTPSKP